MLGRHQAFAFNNELEIPSAILAEFATHANRTRRLRSLSKFHETNPFWFGGSRVGYEPAESLEMLKGGNSNWRGPVWFPTAYMLIESFRKLGKAYGPRFTIESQVEGEPNIMAGEFANRLIRLFTRDDTGRRPVHGMYSKF